VVAARNPASYTDGVKRALRILGLILVLVIATAGGVYLVRGGGGGGDAASGLPPGAEGMKIPLSNEGCRECHPEIYAQWEASYHALAWDDPQLQVAGMRIKEKKDCWPCHVPSPIFLAGFGKVPPPRSHARSEGVGCTACHYTPQGMAGSVDDPAAPCQPVDEPGIRTIEHCSGCHNQHKTHDEWRTSRFHPDTDCNDCHMPEVKGVVTKGKPPRTYHAHTWPGCHDLETLRKAFRLSARVTEDGEAVIELTNDGAGHHFPTDARFHRADLKADVIREGGEIVNQVDEVFRNPFRYVIGVPNTQIKPGEKKVYRWTLRETKGVLRVRLLYCLQPSPGDVSRTLSGNNHVLLEELRIPFP